MKNKMILIPSGIFEMGSNENIDERPVHHIMLPEFYIENILVTQQMFLDVMYFNPSHFKSDLQRPIEQVTWYDAILYCNKRSEIEGLEKCYSFKGEKFNKEGNCTEFKNIEYNFKINGYRLPTEAEWEYACRAGTKTKYYWGNKIDDDYCWYDKNSNKTIHPIGLKKSNKFGLYDMIGNVWEWCWDLYDENYYSKSPAIFPTGPEEGNHRVLRGGSWNYIDGYLRSAYRNAVSPSLRYSDNGFRCVRLST